MFTRTILFGGLICISMAMPSKAEAASANGRLGASVLDIKSLSVEEMRELCEAEPEIKQCDMVREKKEEKQLSNNNQVVRVSTYNYTVFNTNLE